MKHLLDVNALIALAHTGHSLHGKTKSWYKSVANAAEEFHTCAITELGFVRVSVVTGLQPDIASAKTALEDLKSSSRNRFSIISDDLGAADLPGFVKGPQSITDGHLLSLARKHGAQLVTLDKGIPGALVIA